MILRVRYLLLVNGWTIELGGPWPGPDGKPATVEGDDPDRPGEKKPFKLPAKVGPIFFVKDESEGYPDKADDEIQLASGERSYYEIWAAPDSQKAANYLGGEILQGPCSRRFRISEQHVLVSEEIWPFAAADAVIQRRSKDIQNEYEDLLGDKAPKAIEPGEKQQAQEAPAQTS